MKKEIKKYEVVYLNNSKLIIDLCFLINEIKEVEKILNKELKNLSFEVVIKRINFFDGYYIVNYFIEMD